jgi:protein required for attachment to host cells
VKTWVVVADSSVARLFLFDEGDHKLIAIDTLVHPASTLMNQEIDTDRPGRVRKGRNDPRVFAMSTQVSPHREQMRQFAHTLARKLKHEFDRNHYDRLVLIAPPRFMGLLNQLIDTRIPERIITRVQRDLARIHEPELRDRVAEILSVTAAIPVSHPSVRVARRLSCSRTNAGKW